MANLITESSSENGYIHFPELPIESQKYILNRIVEIYDTKELHKGETVHVSDYNGFYNLEDFIRWLTELKSGQYGEINHEAIESAISKAIEPLNEKDVQYLFEKKYLVRSGDPITTMYTSMVDKFYKQLASDMKSQSYQDSLYDEYSDARYSGSIAQEESYSDDDIDTIFDGDPDAYWNID